LVASSHEQYFINSSTDKVISRSSNFFCFLFIAVIYRLRGPEEKNCARGLENLKNIKHEYENSRKLARNTKKTYSFSKNVHAFFMNMVAEKLWNKNVYAWRFGFDKFSCS
jgi:hypothetical protein